MIARPYNKKEKRMKTFRFLILLFSVFLYKSVFAGEFPIQVNDSSGLEEPWPIVATLPFGRGELKDPSSIRIMSGEREVPCQIDVAATWKDGSLRWAHAGFTASPGSHYRAEYGNGIKRAPHPSPMKISKRADGGLSVDTGAAIYQFEPDKLLPDKAWLLSGNSKRQILEASGGGTYLVDNRGRKAVVGGKESGIENIILKEGPGRLVLKRSGWYVTDMGERLARAETWIYLAAGTAYMRITHSIVFTENTNNVWIRDYGLDFRTPGAPSDVYFSVSKPDGQEMVKKTPAMGREMYILQDSYPHFAQRDYRAVIGASSGGRDVPVEDVGIAGDWAYGDYGDYGITLVMPWLAERFPKELSFGPAGARAVMWSGRSGRELDFRAKTVAREYLQEWADVMLKKPSDKDLEAVKSNAQGAARTHDIWFMPTTGGYSEKKVDKPAAAASRPPLAMAEPERMCATEAMGYPMHHKDTARFPREEALLSDLWDRFVIPLYTFPMNGYMAWGCYPDRSYGSGNNKVMSIFQVISSLRDYGVKREPWRLYARSGERRYYNWGHKLSRFSADWYIAHADAPGKRKGGFIPTNGARGLEGRLPLFWGNKTITYVIDAGDIGNWLLEYWLTGDEYSLDVVKTIKESFRKNNWRPKESPKQFHATGIRTLVTLMIMDWDPEAVKAAKEIVSEMVDLKIQNGINLFAGHYGSQYKDHRASHNLAEYYLETGDEIAKEGFLKLLDQRYRYDRRRRAVSYKNYDGFVHSIAYWITGNERDRIVVEQALRDMLYYSSKNSLEKNLSQKPADILKWPNLYVDSVFGGPRSNIFLGHYEYHNPFIGIPTALKLISEKGWSGKTTPLIVKPMEYPDSKVVFSHEKGRDTTLNFYIKTRYQERKPIVTSLSGNIPVKGIRLEEEQQMSGGKYFKDRPKEFPPTGRNSLYVSVGMPADAESGLYLLTFAPQTTFTFLDSTSQKAALYCPDGFWSVSFGDHSGEKPYGRSGEGMPAFFRVPRGLEKLGIFLGRPASVISPDGSVVIEASNKNIGSFTIPAKGKDGVWKIEYHIHNFEGLSTPVFVKLLNVEPVISFGTPDLLPGATGMIPGSGPAETSPSASLEFVPGVSGRAVRLSGEKTLLFDRGSAVAQGGYENFPGATGTVEFWFKADRSTFMVPLEMSQTKSMGLIRGPFINMYHNYSGMSHYPSIQSFLVARIYSLGSESSPGGFESTHYFIQDMWTHIAFTWDIRKGNTSMEGEINIFVNGEKLGTAGGRSAPYPIKNLEDLKPFDLATGRKDISIGPFEGAMDMLRISDCVRYKDNFTPSRTPWSPDPNTRAIFNFDGNLQAISPLSRGRLEAK